MELNADHTVELPKKYRARVEIKTKTNYATDKDIKRYSLLGLTPV